MNKQPSILKLQYPVILSDLNKSLHRENNALTTELELGILKYKHLRELQQVNPQDHITYVLRQITNLTENDLNEVSAEDSADLIAIAFTMLQKNAEVAKKFLVEVPQQ